MENPEIKILINSCRESCFNKQSYSVNVRLKDFPLSLSLHTDYDGINKEYTTNENFSISDIDFDKFLLNMTPQFQRANNKWNKKMKIKFIENICKGVKTEILLFQFKEEDDAQIIDGLQRTTALLDFFQNKIKIFGEFYYKDLKNDLNKFNTNIHIKRYLFKTWEEVGRFYIDINENITHSKADIQKAKDWFLKEKGIIL